MNGARRLALAFGIAAAAISLWVSRDDGPLHWLARGPVALELERAAAVGFPTRLELGEGDRAALEAHGRRMLAAHGGRETILVLSRQAAVLLPSAGLAPLLPPAAVDALILRWVGPFLLVGDENGAARGFVRGLLEALVRTGRMPGRPPLSALPSPSALPPVFDSAPWGVPLALAIALGALLARARAGPPAAPARRRDAAPGAV